MAGDSCTRPSDAGVTLLINLVKNAIEVMSDSGPRPLLVRVSTAIRIVAIAWITRLAGAPSGEPVRYNYKIDSQPLGTALLVPRL
jgi:hypothetical protein